jgi:hypothetical protein
MRLALVAKPQQHFLLKRLPDMKSLFRFHSSLMMH